MADEPAATPEAEPATPTEPVAPPQDDADAQHKRLVRLTQVGLLAIAVLIAGIVVLSKSGDDGKGKDKAPDAASSNEKPAKKGWPTEVGGRPPALGVRGQLATEVTVQPGTPPGVYLWNDFDGWHLWVVSGEGIGAINGTISSNDAVSKAELAIPGAGSVTIEDQVVTFVLPADGPLSGIDFNPGFFGDQLVFTLNGPDGPLDAEHVFLGAKSAPAPFPLLLEKAA